MVINHDFKPHMMASSINDPLGTMS